VRGLTELLRLPIAPTFALTGRIFLAQPANIERREVRNLRRQRLHQSLVHGAVVGRHPFGRIQK